MPSVSLLKEFKSAFCDHSVSRVTALCEESKAALRFVLLEKDSPPEGEVGPSDRELTSLMELGRPIPKYFTRSDLQVALDMFETFKRYYSPVAYFTETPILQRLDRCMEQHGLEQELHGECLLQKVLVFESVYGKGAEFKESSARFIEWFDQLRPTSPNYEKLKQAKSILLAMAVEKQERELAR